MSRFRFDRACNNLYHFFWHELCDWYIEFAKPALAGSAPRPRAAETLLFVLDASLRLLHPVMPHLTEELWQRLPRDPSSATPNSIAVQEYPLAAPELADPDAERGMAAVIAVVQAARSLRRERNLAAVVKMTLAVEGGDSDLTAFVIEQGPLLRAVGGVAEIGAGAGAASALRSRAGGLNLAFEVEAAPMSEAERARLGKELGRVDAEIAGARNRLANAGFLAKAPAHVVEGNRSRLAELERRRRRLLEMLDEPGFPSRSGAFDEAQDRRAPSNGRRNRA